MAWYRTGDKPLPEPMMTQFNDASPGLNELTFEAEWLIYVSVI